MTTEEKVPAELTQSIFDSFCAKYYYDHERTNLRAELQNIARHESAKYILKNMLHVNSYPNRYELYDNILPQAPKDGLWLEFGVYTGETINYISGFTKNQIYGFDSFEGLPEFWRDGFDRGHFAVKGLPRVNSNVVLFKGWFEQTLPDFLVNTQGDVAFLHVDSDLYSSAVTIFKLLGDRIKSGTIIIFDEYFNYPGWQEGEHRAFREFVERSGIRYEYLSYVNNHQQVAVRIQ
jgi:hypothetical protein